MDLDALASNILQVYERALPEHVTEGLSWYDDARELARTLARDHGVSVETAAGVIAALSPRLFWSLNAAYAERFLATGDAPVLGNSKRAAARIMRGEQPTSVLLGQKVSAFYACIMGDENAVCVDSHAHDIAVNKRYGIAPRKLLLRKGGYDLIASAYRMAAAKVGLSASAIQAVTWVTWRDYKPKQLALEV